MKLNPSWLLLLGCCLIPVLNFPQALFSDRALFVRDISSVWSPQIESVVRQVASGEPPFFDARRGFGQPLFADPRAEVLYPPAWLHWVVPPDRSYALFCAIHLVIAALGAARLARRLNPEGGLAAALTAAFIYGASGPLLSLVAHWHHLAAAAWMPWIIERCDRRPGDPTPWLSLAALVTLQTLAGSPDYSFLTLLLCGLRLGTRADLGAPARLKLILAFGLGLLLSSVQILPSLAFAADADRPRLPVGWALGPLHPALTLETILPIRAEAWRLRPPAAETLLGGQQVWMFSHYLGLVSWVFAWIGLPRTRAPDRRFAMGAVLMGIVLSWGIQNLTLQDLVASVPLVSGLRFPTKYLAAASLGLAILASHALPGRSFRPRALLAGLGCVLLSFLGLQWWATGTAMVNVPTLVPLALPLAVSLGIAAVAGQARRLAPLIPILVVADLLVTLRDLNPTTEASLFRDRSPLTSVLPPGSRLFVSDYSIGVPKTDAALSLEGEPVREAAGIPYRLKETPVGFNIRETVVLAALWYLNPPMAGRFGYYGSFDLDILDFYRRPLKRQIQRFVTSRDPDFIVNQLRRGSVDYVVTMDAPQLWASLPLVITEHRFFEDPVRVYRVPAPWPRVRYETEEGELAALGSLDVLEMKDGRVVIHAAPEEPTRLVVAWANDRGWRAHINGVRTAVTDSPMAFISVALPRGAHRVELEYRPPLLLSGGLLSLTALLTILWLGLPRETRPPRQVA